jgi:hypothetical protein
MHGGYWFMYTLVISEESDDRCWQLLNIGARGDGTMAGYLRSATVEFC